LCKNLTGEITALEIPSKRQMEVTYFEGWFKNKCICIWLPLSTSTCACSLLVAFMLSYIPPPGAHYMALHPLALTMWYLVALQELHRLFWAIDVLPIGMPLALE
jgi:hypothetical protein